MASDDSSLLAGILTSTRAARQPSGAAADPSPGVAPLMAVSPAADAPRAWRPIDGSDQTDVPYAKGGGSFRPGDGGQRSELRRLEQRFTLRSSILELARKPTLDDVLDACRQYESRPLWIGQMVAAYLAGQADRAKGLREVRLALVRADMVGTGARIDQFLRLYWVGWLLGWDDAQDLRVAAIRELVRLVARNAADESYALRANCERPAIALWRRMVRERLPAHAVRAAVLEIRPPSKKRGAKPSGKFLALCRDLRRLAADESQLLAIVKICQDRLANRVPASEAYQPAA